MTDTMTDQVWKAVMNCPHTTTHDEITLRFSPGKDGINASYQLYERIRGALTTAHKPVTDEATQSIVDWLCDDVLPAYGIEGDTSRNDVELFAATKTALEAAQLPARTVVEVIEAARDVCAEAKTLAMTKRRRGVFDRLSSALSALEGESHE